MLDLNKEDAGLPITLKDGSVINLRDPSRKEMIGQESELKAIEASGETQKALDVMDKFVLGLGFPEKEYHMLSFKAQQKVYKYCMGVSEEKKS